MSEARVIFALLTALIGLVAWIGSRLWNKMDNVEGKVDEHNAKTIERLSRVENIERIVLKRA